MRIGYLEEFIAVATSLSFNQTARALHISQSYLSKHIAALEDDLQAHLFERDRRQVSLTSQGQVLLDQAAVIVKAYQSVKDSFAAEASNRSALSIGGCIDAPGEFAWLSAATAALQQADPAFSPHFIPCHTTAPVSQLLSGNIDCAIMSYHPHDFDEGTNERIAFEPLATSPFRAVVTASHPLVDRHQLSLNDLQGRAVIQMMGPRMVSGWNNLNQVLHAHRIAIQPVQRTVMSVLDTANVRLDQEVLILPECEVRRQHMHDDTRRVIPFAEEEAVFSFDMVYLRDRKPPLLERFMEELRRTPL